MLSFLAEAWLSAEDLTFLRYLALDETRRQLPKCFTNPLPECANIPIENRGYNMKFSDMGPNRELTQFDTAKPINGVPPGTFKGTIPHAAEERNEGKNPNIVSSSLVVQYPIGCQMKALCFPAAFDRHAVEGRECSCCLFHRTPVCEGPSDCPVHVG